MHDEKLKKHLDKAYLWLSKIPVTGEAVDYMAMARQEMRAAFQVVNAKSEQEDKTDG